MKRWESKITISSQFLYFPFMNFPSSSSRTMASSCSFLYITDPTHVRPSGQQDINVLYKENILVP